MGTGRQRREGGSLPKNPNRSAEKKKGTSLPQHSNRSTEKKKGGDMIPLQNIEMGTSGGASVEAEPLNNASSILFSIREEDETEVDLYS